MEQYWTERELTVLSGLKRHLVNPCLNEIPKVTCDIIQSVMYWMNREITFTGLWDLPASSWSEISRQSDLSNESQPAWMLEVFQTLAYILTGKIYPLKHNLTECLDQFMTHTEWDDIPEFLPQPFPGHPLKELATAGEAAKCKLHLDLSKNPEKKRQSVLHIMLNCGHFQAAAEFHQLCGGGLEKIPAKLLFSVWSNASVGKISEDFDRIVMAILKPSNEILVQHDKGKWGKRMRLALETGCADADMIVFEDRDCKMTLFRYMHFLYEIREELLQIDIGDKLKSDVIASKIFMEWENNKKSH